jgi:hypothetical protein
MNKKDMKHQRRSKLSDIHYDSLPKDKKGLPIFPNSGVPAGKPAPSFMKVSRRRAGMRRIAKRLRAGEITLGHAKLLSQFVLAGTASRRQIYGGHPTKAVK